MSGVNFEREKIENYIEEKKPVIFSLNFVPDFLKPDFSFFSNGKRYIQFASHVCKTIITSNIKDNDERYVLNYNRLRNVSETNNNSLLVILSLLKILDVNSVGIAGADGYVGGAANYYNDAIKSLRSFPQGYNEMISQKIKSLEIKIEWVTSSAYEK